MKDKLYDWKDVANAQFAKAMSLSLVLLTFVLMVTPNIEVRKQKFTSTQMEVVDLPMEEREKLEQPPSEIEIEVPIMISDELSSDKSDPALTAKYEQALAEIGNVRSTTASTLTRDGEMVNFVAYDDAPVPLGSISPVYPDFARRARVQGTVMLEVEVYRDGNVGNIKVLRSVTGLDDAAIAAVRKVKFQPGKSGGQSVDTTVILPVEFRLN